jgi:hypothetical protein
MVAGDLNGDGRTDLAVASDALPGLQIFVARCLGCRFMGQPSADSLGFLTPTAARGLALGDFDGDGDLDIAVSMLPLSPGGSSRIGTCRNHVTKPTSLDRDANGVPDECDDCAGTSALDSCEIANGTLVDCNQNLEPDVCEPLTPANDCNADGQLDVCQIANGQLQDCNGNLIPDVCEIASGAVPDCNGNGRPDSCDVGAMYSRTSPQLPHIFYTSPQSYVFSSPPAAATFGSSPTVKLKFAANADFAAFQHRIRLTINSTVLSSNYDAYAGSYWGCDSPYGPDLCEVTLPAGYFNSIKGTGNLTVIMTPYTTVPSQGMHECGISDSYIQVTLEYSIATSPDLNQNGIPDECPGG